MEVYKSTRTAAELNYALGAVPSIGPNGNWFIGDVDTGVFAGGIKITGAEPGQIARITEVDQNGAPTAWKADYESGGKTLVAEFTHDANLVVQPTAFDASTGVFTCRAHGITPPRTGSIIVINDGVKYDETKIPGKFTGAQLTVVDADSFTINGWNYASDANLSKVDVTAFHFELPLGDGIQFDNIPVHPHLRVEIRGKVVCTSWNQFRTSLTDDANMIIQVADKGSYYGWGRPGYAYGDARGIFELSSDIYVSEDEVTAHRSSVRADQKGGNIEFQNFLGIYKTPSNLKTFYIQHSYSGDINQGIANGATIKVYKVG